MLFACGLLQTALACALTNVNTQACAWVNVYMLSISTEQQGYNGEYLS